MLHFNVQAVAALDLADGAERDARLALGGVARVPWRARDAEAALIGRPATAETFGAAAEAAVRDMRPTADNRLKVQPTRRFVVRALTGIVEDAS